MSFGAEWSGSAMVKQTLMLRYIGHNCPNVNPPGQKYPKGLPLWLAKKAHNDITGKPPAGPNNFQPLWLTRYPLSRV
jgi:hypothetical protein